jgi:ABC-2 type transport system ATP-binding protein
VTIIRNGRTVESGTLTELRHLTRNSVTAVTRRDPAPLAGLTGVHDLSVDGHRVTFLVDNEHGLDAVTRELAGLWACAAWSAAPPSLEELFLRHYGDELAALGEPGAR